MREREGAGWKGVKDKEEKRKEKKRKRKRYGKKRCSFGKRVCVCCFDKSNHSFTQSILKTPLNSTTIPSHNSSSTHTHTSLTHIHHSNQQQHMSQSSIKSLPHQSSLFFITQINLFLHSLCLCVFDVIERIKFPSSKSITYHTPSSLPFIVNELCGGDCHE